jgi:hypothetical protein
MSGTTDLSLIGALTRAGMPFFAATELAAAIEDLVGPGGGASDWGDLGGTLADQTDLQTALDAKADEKAAVSLTGANTLLQATHSNRSLNWTGGTTQAQALPVAQTAGDIIDFFNGGSVPVTFTNVTAAAGYKNSCLPNERFTAETDGTTWFSATPRVNNAIIALTDGANIATDLDLSGMSSVTLGGNRTLDNPTNPQDGGVYGWWITQDGAGSRTLALGNKFKKAAADSLTLSTGINKVDFLSATYNSTKDIYLTSIKLDVA